MKAARLLAPTKIEVQEVARPQLGAGEVMIQPMRVGICGSDVSFFQGHRPVPYPFLLGHELVGRVVAVADDVTKLSVGQRVVVEPNYSCGTCSFCRAGRGSICPNKKSMGVTVPGCFADFASAPAEFVWAVPDCISDVDAATIEPLTVSVHGLLVAGCSMGDAVAVLGCGVVGLLLIHAAVRQGIRVLAHDKFEDKLRAARELGAETPAAGDLAKLWLGENVTTVFECAGVSATVEMAFASAPRGSQIVLLGLSTAPASLVPLRIVREGITILPSLIYDHPGDFARVIALVANGTLKPSCVVTDTFEFASIGRALELASTGQSGKVITVISG